MKNFGESEVSANILKKPLIYFFTSFDSYSRVYLRTCVGEVQVRTLVFTIKSIDETGSERIRHSSFIFFPIWSFLSNNDTNNYLWDHLFFKIFSTLCNGQSGQNSTALDFSFLYWMQLFFTFNIHLIIIIIQVKINVNIWKQNKVNI